MRGSVSVVVHILVLSLIVGVVYFHQDFVIILKEPPKSIAQWYKPQNKRQVWLHLMFKLRREMLAAEIYAKANDAKNLQKWLAKLDKNYRKIGEMVPPWQKKLDMLTMGEIQKSANENRYNNVSDALARLGDSCNSCHTDFRALTAAIYRAPDFSRININDSTSLIAHMRKLSKQVNKIKIAFVDNRDDAALAALADLTKSMQRLGGVCDDCHKNPAKTYPDANMTQAMQVLGQSLKTGSLKDKGRDLGALAVISCGRCHGTHRLASDVKKMLGKEKSWGELFRHSAYLISGSRSPVK